MTKNLEVGIFTSIEDLDIGEWDAIVTGSHAPVFYRSRYLRAYERFPLTSVKLFGYFVIRDRGRPVAVLPVSLIDGLDPLGQLRGGYPLTGQELGLLSHVWHCYDAGLPELSGESRLRAAVGALRELARDQGAAWYGFVNVPHGSPLRAGLTDLGFPAVHIEDRFQLDLRGMDSVESYFAALSRSGRANLTRNRRRATEAGVRWQVRPAADADLAEIGALCAKTAASHGTGGFYPADLFTGFVTALGDLAVAIEVRQGERLVAAGIGLRDETRFHAWACGVDYDVAGGFSPYPLLHAATVEQAITEGRAVFEGGRGNHVFKLRHGLSRLPLDACLLEV